MPMQCIVTSTHDKNVGHSEIPVQCFQHLLWDRNTFSVLKLPAQVYTNAYMSIIVCKQLAEVMPRAFCPTAITLCAVCGRVMRLVASILYTIPIIHEHPHTKYRWFKNRFLVFFFSSHVTRWRYIGCIPHEWYYKEHITLIASYPAFTDGWKERLVSAVCECAKFSKKSGKPCYFGILPRMEYT